MAGMEQESELLYTVYRASYVIQGASHKYITRGED